jgi:hypothetical protein
MSNILIWLLIVVAALILLVFGFRIFFSRSAFFHYRGLALQVVPGLLPPESAGLGAIVLASYREHRANTIRWSAAYFGCTFGSALLSASSGVVLKIASFPNATDVAAVSAAVAALLVTLSTAGDFHRKWLANRGAATAMENLAYDLLKSHVELDVIVERLKEINTRRNDEIVRGSVAPQVNAGKVKPPESTA